MKTTEDEILKKKVERKWSHNITSLLNRHDLNE